MKKSKEFIDMVDADIKKCENYFEDRKNEMQLFQELFGRYSKSSTNFPAVENNSLLLRMHSEVVGNNIRAIYGFLVAFRNSSYDDYYMNSDKSSISITNMNSNENNININLTFQNVRDKIENMSALNEEEIQLILAKIDKLETIVNSKDRKSKKWDNAKEIIKWVADKGVDVGITLLPLILKIS